MKKKESFLVFLLILGIIFIGQTLVSVAQVLATLQPLLMEIDRLGPDFGPPGIIVSIYPTTDNFGEQMRNDRVQMSEYDIVGNKWLYVDVPIYKWSPDKILFKVPGMTFHAGIHYVRVKKTDAYGNIVYSTPWKEFNIREHPDINYLTPSTGGWGTVVAIKGSGFGDMQERIYKGDEILGDGIGNDDGICEALEACYPDYGYSTYVDLFASNDHYRATVYPKSSNGNDWELNDISFKLENLLDINTGNPVPAQDLYTGCWNVKVITDYFEDDGDGKYNYSIAGLDTPTNPRGIGSGDRLLYRDSSDPVCFTATAPYLSPPYISTIILYKVAEGTYLVQITGTGFGATQGAGYVLVGSRIITGTDIIWSNTSIKFKVSYISSPYPRLVTVTIKVMRNDGSISNGKTITVLL
jgi:hypothetical protein